MPYFKVDALEDFDQTVQTVPAYVGNPNFGLGHNIGHSVGWVERSETQQLIGVGFRSSTQPTGNSYGLKYDQGQKRSAVGWTRFLCPPCPATRLINVQGLCSYTLWELKIRWKALYLLEFPKAPPRFSPPVPSYSWLSH